MRQYTQDPDDNSPGASPADDVFAKLRQDRILFLTDEINSEKASAICAQLLALDMCDPGKDIILFINSEGGTITDTMAIYDMMSAVRSDVSTICIGEAASAGAILLSGGAAGKRYALPNARIMIHQPQGGVEGSTRDVEIEAAELVKLRDELYCILSRHTGQPREVLKKYMDRDTYMRAGEARDFGIIDRVIDRLPDFARCG